MSSLGGRKKKLKNLTYLKHGLQRLFQKNIEKNLEKSYHKIWLVRKFVISLHQLKQTKTI